MTHSRPLQRGEVDQGPIGRTDDTAASIIVLDSLAVPITRRIGTEGLLVTEKVFGLIVVAIAVSGMATALRVLFPGLVGGAG